MKSALRPEDVVLIMSQNNQKRFIEVYSFEFVLADDQSSTFFREGYSIFLGVILVV